MIYETLTLINTRFPKIFIQKHQFRITTFVKMAQVGRLYIE